MRSGFRWHSSSFRPCLSCYVSDQEARETDSTNNQYPVQKDKTQTKFDRSNLPYQRGASYHLLQLLNGEWPHVIYTWSLNKTITLMTLYIVYTVKGLYIKQLCSEIKATKHRIARKGLYIKQLCSEIKAT